VGFTMSEAFFIAQKTVLWSSSVTTTPLSFRV